MASGSNKRDALTAQECIIEFVHHTDECSHLHRRQVGALANTCLLSLNSVPLNSAKITENDPHLELLADVKQSELRGFW